MAPRSNRIKFLFEKFLINRCTAEELDELFLYIKNFPEDTALREIIDADAMTAAGQERLIPELSASLKAGVDKSISQESMHRQTRDFHQSRHLFLKIAAVLIPAMVCIAVVYFQMKPWTEVIIKTSFGQVKTITLPDNSSVVLNGNSTLRYLKNWDIDKDREVVLEGEGYFKVTHQRNHKKFLVHTSNKITIEVLGTEFNVNDREDRIQIVLQSGKIKLGLDHQHPEKDILMRSGDYVEVSSKGKVRRKVMDTQPYTAWQSSKLIFKDTPLHDILLILKDSYGYKLNVRDSLLLQETFTANYPANDVNVLLEALRKAFEISVNRDEKEILIGI